MPWNTSEYINRADSMHFLLWLLCQDQGFCPRLFSPPNRFAAVIGSPRKTCQRRTCQLIPLRTHKMQRSVLDNASEDQTKQVHLLMKLPCPGPSLLNGGKPTQSKSQNQMRPAIQKERKKKPRLECWRTYSTCFLASFTSLQTLQNFVVFGIKESFSTTCPRLWLRFHRPKGPSPVPVAQRAPASSRPRVGHGTLCS